ncbi:tyrosine-type recombinase/integrase [Aeromonas caviae]|uniref:tyrosine-type recombinase/integrase n=1 Tax=Aeromonas caviae TaxID=648 RepID=UPI0039F4A4C5
MAVSIGEEIVSLDIDVHLYPQLTVSLDKETGEFAPVVTYKNPKTKKLRVLLNRNGTLLYPQNLYLHHLISKRGLKETNLHAKALLLFSRWLEATNRKYTEVYENPEDGVAWQFGDWLIDHNLKSINEQTGEVANEDGLAIKTAKAYMLVVIDFYKYLNSERILPWSDSVKPFNFYTIRINDYDASNDNHMLSHTFKRRALVVTTTDRMRSFPKVQSMQAWQKLKPLTPADQVILAKYIGNDDSKSLMVRLARDGGLRINEVITLSERAIYAPLEDPCKLTLDPVDGVLTKGNKQRTTEIPKELMQALYEYKLSSERTKKLAGKEHGRLFITPDGTELNVNTLEAWWSRLRKKIDTDLRAKLQPDDKRLLSKKPLWYYRFHDLRSTFATEWLRLQQRTRNAPYDFYFSELKQLLGHELNTDTQKYIDFVNHFDIFSAAATNRNAEAARALKEQKNG